MYSLSENPSVKIYWTAGKRLNDNAFLPFFWMPFQGTTIPFESHDLWGYGQPNGGDQNCLFIYSSNDIHDAACAYLAAVICEARPFLV